MPGTKIQRKLSVSHAQILVQWYTFILNKLHILPDPFGNGQISYLLH